MCSPGSRLISPLLLFFFLTYLAKGDVFTGRSFIYSLQFKDTYSVNHRHFHFKYPKKREVLFVSNFIILVIFLLCTITFLVRSRSCCRPAETPKKKKSSGGQKRLLLVRVVVYDFVIKNSINIVLENFCVSPTYRLFAIVLPQDYVIIITATYTIPGIFYIQLLCQKKIKTVKIYSIITLYIYISINIFV